MRLTREPRHARAVARRAQLVLATTAPLAVADPGADADALVVEAVGDSARVHAEVLAVLDAVPQGPLTDAAESARGAVGALLALRADWRAYCDRSAGLDPAATDDRTEMQRLWVTGDQARGWPRLDEARAARAAAHPLLVRLEAESGTYCGTDLQETRRRAHPGNA